MKNLSITLGLILMLATSQAVFAEETSLVENTQLAMDTVVVVAEPEVANFEIFSLQHSETALNEAMNMVMNTISLSLSEESATLVDLAAKIGTSI